ncbi:MAG: hypothetical protein AABX38_04375 [Candidatus Micrarchaeota archaeon]
MKLIQQLKDFIANLTNPVSKEKRIHDNILKRRKKVYEELARY